MRIFVTHAFVRIVTKKDLEYVYFSGISSVWRNGKGMKLRIEED